MGTWTKTFETTRSGAADKGRPVDVVIVGAGLAGLFTALELAPHPVTVVAAAPLGEGASSVWAQGGIAAAVGKDDTPEAHARDTIVAGAGTVDTHVAALVAREAAARIRDLVAYGVPFDRDASGGFVLSREAAHSANRVVRVSGDRAGAAIMQSLIAAVRKTPTIRLLEGYDAEDLIVGDDGRVEGVRLTRSAERGNGTYELLPAAAVVLATGGVGGLYAVTTNPSYARGEGLAMAARAGAVIADAEFVQFHPTALDVGKRPAPLASEALRGEGAVLVNRAGERFMKRIHPDAELAPRDVVARGVFAEIKAGHGAFLDCREAIGAEFPERFPTVYGYARDAGLDPVTGLLPVAPAAHYHMGGVETDDCGRSTVPGLWAIGEVSSTGLHGANRLASNSLLEAVVFGARAAADIRTVLPPESPDSVHASLRRVEGAPRSIADLRQRAVERISRVMTDNVGVVRERAGLEGALTELTTIEAEARGDTMIANMALAARFITAAALARHESRGGHYRSDFPTPDAAEAHRSRLTLADLASGRNAARAAISDRAREAVAAR